MTRIIYKRLADISYPRPSGSKEEKQAAAYIEGEIRKIGFEPQREEFTYTRRIPLEASLSAEGKDGEWVSFPVTGVVDSQSTLEEGETIGFYYLKSFDEVALTRIKGKIVLIHDRLTGEEYRRLRQAGIAGYITTSGTVRDTCENSDLETGRFRDNLKDEGSVPAFTIRMTDAVALLRLRPSRVRIRLILKEETVRSQNIVVTVPGKSRKEEIIAAGAHYDSVPFSYGSWDNGAGTVQMLSLLEALKEKAPKRTVRVIFFGSEETGLKGSRAYLEAHQEETENIKLMINADVGRSILGKEILFVGAGPETEGFLRSFLKEVGYEAVLFSKLMSSDSANFNDYGIPSISIGQGAPRGGGYMHTRYDNMDLMDENVLDAEAAFLIKLTERLAGAEVIPVPGYIPEALRKQVIEYFGQEKSVLARTPSLPDPKPLKQHF